MREVDAQEARANGIWTAHHQMDNDEYRYRLVAADGCSYIRVEASEKGGWQKSHLHEYGHELYILQKGRASLVIMRNGNAICHEIQPYQSMIIEPGVAHNVYLAPDSVTHTIKYGDCRENDWVASPSLDEWIEKHS